GGERGSPGQEAHPGDGHDLAVVVAQQVGDRVADCYPQGPAFEEGVHDGADVVMGDDDVGSVARRGGASGPEGDAYIGEADGGCVVDAVPGHGHTVTEVAVGSHEPRLVGRRDAGAYGEVGQDRGEGFVV